jgi:DNA-binding MarR family transcriptional regulator
MIGGHVMTAIRRMLTTITPRQLEVLTHLSLREQCSIGEVALLLGVSSAAATKAVARLERKGLVSRTVNTTDRRCVNVRVTRAGSEIIRQETR